jgi:hypothetical protein
VDIVSLFGKSNLGPAAKALVEKIAAGIGVAYAPINTIVQAWASVKADQIKASGEIEVESVRRRAAERFLAEETRKQQNLEAIYGKTVLLLEPTTEPETIARIDEDWISFHSEKARLVSDIEMQSLWAQLLAREAESPGSFSRRTLEFLATLEKSEAQDFTNLCRYAVEVGGKKFPLVLHEGDDLQLAGDRTAAVDHLGSIGLLRGDDVSVVGVFTKEKQLTVTYFGENRLVDVSGIRPVGKTPHYAETFVPMGRLEFTKIGLELSRISGAEPLTDFWTKRHHYGENTLLFCLIDPAQPLRRGWLRFGLFHYQDPTFTWFWLCLPCKPLNLLVGQRDRPVMSRLVALP